MISMDDEEAQARAEAKASAATGIGRDGRNPAAVSDGAELSPAARERTKAEATSDRLMELVVERGNMWTAYERVMRNKGAPGVDGMTVDELKAWLRSHWPTVRAALLKGSYMPRAVRAVDIPKPAGGVRTLGVPTVADRLIQQALLQILQPIFEPEFSASSYGFRPGRNAWQAVQAARAHVRGGRSWVVDIDLAKFFDRVNHDLLMARVARKVGDRRMLGLIRRFLEAGLMRDGIAHQRQEGTPQGGPLSPLLSNIMRRTSTGNWSGAGMPSSARRMIATCISAAKPPLNMRSKRSGVTWKAHSGCTSIWRRAQWRAPTRATSSGTD